MDVIDPGWNFYLLQEKRKNNIDLLDRENENVIIKGGNTTQWATLSENTFNLLPSGQYDEGCWGRLGQTLKSRLQKETSTGQDRRTFVFVPHADEQIVLGDRGRGGGACSR